MHVQMAHQVTSTGVRHDIDQGVVFSACCAQMLHVHEQLEHLTVKDHGAWREAI